MKHAKNEAHTGEAYLPKNPFHELGIQVTIEDSVISDAFRRAITALGVDPAAEQVRLLKKAYDVIRLADHRRNYITYMITRIVVQPVQQSYYLNVPNVALRALRDRYAAANQLFDQREATSGRNFSDGFTGTSANHDLELQRHHFAVIARATHLQLLDYVAALNAFYAALNNFQTATAATT